MFHHSRRVSSFLAALMLVCLAATEARAVVIYDVASDFANAPTQNAAGTIWHYGNYTTVGDPSTFTQYTTFSSPGGALTGLDVWSTSGDPNVAKNVTGTTINAFGITFDPGKFVFGPLSGPSVARFTAPVAGVYTITSTFKNVQPTNTSADASVFLYDTSNIATTLLAATVVNTGSPVNYNNLSITLAAGDRLDFTAEPNLGSPSSTQLELTISVPEPSSLALLFFGGLGLTGLFRRKR